jgi:hypothetical protein
MKNQTKTIAAGALALAVGLANVSGTPAPSSSQANPAVDYAPAAAALASLKGQLEQIPSESWKHSLFQESAVHAAASAQLTFESAKAEADLAKAAGILEFAAWHLDSIILHMDGQAGESDTAHEDDWVEDATLTASIHGLALEARTEVFRARRQP